MRKILAIGAICALGAVIYANSFTGDFTFDDTIYIRDNLALRNIGDIGGIWSFWPSRFIAFLSFAVNYYFSGLNLVSLHATNLLIHLSASVLVYWLVRLTFSTPAVKLEAITKYARPLALFSALIFLAHPIQTEAVTYLYQRVTSLAGFFYLLCLCLYVKSRLLQLSGATAAQWGRFYAASLAAGIAALFTKENTATLPIMIAIYEFYFFAGGKKFKIKPLLPYLFFLAVIPAVYLFFHPLAKPDMERLLSQPVTGAQYFLTQTRVLLTYIRLVILPLNQNLDYDYAISRSLWDLPVLASSLALLAILFFAVRSFAKYRLISFALVWFFVALAVESSFVPIWDVIFEHRLYLPMAGCALLLVAGSYYVFGKRKPYLMFAALSILVAWYSLLTYGRNFVWQNELTLWSDVAKKSPRKARAFYNLGNAYADVGNKKAAERAFARAYQLKPDIENANNLAAMYADQGKVDQAVAIWEEMLQQYPDFTTAHFNLAVFYFQQKKYDAAIQHCDQVLELGSQVDPKFLELLKPYRK